MRAEADAADEAADLHLVGDPAALGAGDVDEDAGVLGAGAARAAFDAEGADLESGRSAEAYHHAGRVLAAKRLDGHELDGILADSVFPRGDDDVAAGRGRGGGSGGGVERRGRRGRPCRERGRRRALAGGRVAVTLEHRHGFERGAVGDGGGERHLQAGSATAGRGAGAGTDAALVAARGQVELAVGDGGVAGELPGEEGAAPLGLAAILRAAGGERGGGVELHRLAGVGSGLVEAPESRAEVGGEADEARALRGAALAMSGDGDGVGERHGLRSGRQRGRAVDDLPRPLGLEAGPGGGRVSGLGPVGAAGWEGHEPQRERRRKKRPRGPRSTDTMRSRASARLAARSARRVPVERAPFARSPEDPRVPCQQLDL